jgi:capsule polysaccharide export protein KpsC/LpsZ
MIGKLSCCAYPGYERYYNSYYGDLKRILDMKDNLPFIAKSHNEDFIYTIEYEHEGTVERFFPWNNTRVSYTI